MVGNQVFGEVVMNDPIPMIDDEHRTLPDREHRAIAGFSMGGATGVTDRADAPGSVHLHWVVQRRDTQL